MTGKIIMNLMILAILGGIAATGIFTGLFAIADQHLDAAGWHDEYNGRGAVFFGATCMLVGISFLFFYMSTWFASKSFIMMGIMCIASTFTIGYTAQYIPDFVLNDYVVPPVREFVNASVRPIFEMVGL